MLQKIKFTILFLIGIYGFAQTEMPTSEKYNAHNKGKFFFNWGWNRAYFSDSDVRFMGSDYDFTIYGIEAHDRPKQVNIEYIKPTTITLPQTNFRIGYFISDKYNISLGYEHMKYVMDQWDVKKYAGYYPNRGAYDENEGDGLVKLTDEFLTFEHTDGLNYINVELTRQDDLSKYIGLPNIDKFQLNAYYGAGGGFLLPKTNTGLLDKERYDEFHLSGIGFGAKAGLNLVFYKYFTFNIETKAGYINMYDIRTSYDSSDRASQRFWFAQPMFSLGGIFKL
jgi:hypothetical protein